MTRGIPSQAHLECVTFQGTAGQVTSESECRGALLPSGAAKTPDVSRHACWLRHRGTAEGLPGPRTAGRACGGSGGEHGAEPGTRFYSQTRGSSGSLGAGVGGGHSGRQDSPPFPVKLSEAVRGAETRGPEKHAFQQVSGPEGAATTCPPCLLRFESVTIRPASGSD